MHVIPHFKLLNALSDSSHPKRERNGAQKNVTIGMPQSFKSKQKKTELERPQLYYPKE